MPDSFQEKSPGIARMQVFKYHAARSAVIPELAAAIPEPGSATPEPGSGISGPAGGMAEMEDNLVIEEPLEIRLIYGSGGQRKEQSVSVTMRTPGHDPELATGFLFTEGIIGSAPGDIITIHQGGGISENSIRIEMKASLDLDLGKLQRNFYTSSSCGVCGKSSIDAIRSISPPPRPAGFIAGGKRY